MRLPIQWLMKTGLDHRRDTPVLRAPGGARNAEARGRCRAFQSHGQPPSTRFTQPHLCWFPLAAHMAVLFVPLLSMSLMVGWAGTQTALYLRHAKSGRWEELFMLILCWSPLAIALLALLLSLSGSNS